MTWAFFAHWRVATTAFSWRVWDSETSFCFAMIR